MSTNEVYMLRDAAISLRKGTGNVDQRNRLTGFILALEIVLGLPSKIETERVARARALDVMEGTALEWTATRNPVDPT